MPPTAVDMTSSSSAASKLEASITRGAAKKKIAEPVKNHIMDNIGRVSNNARGRPKANKSMPADQRHKLDAEQAASALAKEAESVFKEKAAEEKREMDEAEKQRKHEGRIAIKAKKDAERAATKKAKDEQRKIDKAANDLAKQLAKVTEAQQKLAEAKANSSSAEEATNEPTPLPRDDRSVDSSPELMDLTTPEHVSNSKAVTGSGRGHQSKKGSSSSTSSARSLYSSPRRQFNGKRVMPQQTPEKSPIPKSNEVVDIEGGGSFRG